MSVIASVALRVVGCSRATWRNNNTAWRLAMLPSAARAEHIAHGIDCACYFTDNFYVPAPAEGHYTYTGDADFVRENAPLLDRLPDTERARLLDRLRAEADRRRGAAGASRRRRERFRAAYVPLDRPLWTLSDDFLHPDFVGMARVGGALPDPVAEGVYALPVLNEAFCRRLLAELHHIRKSGLDLGRPNSMNNVSAPRLRQHSLASKTVCRHGSPRHACAGRRAAGRARAHARSA